MKLNKFTHYNLYIEKINFLQSKVNELLTKLSNVVFIDFHAGSGVNNVCGKLIEGSTLIFAKTRKYTISLDVDFQKLKTLNSFIQRFGFNNIDIICTDSNFLIINILSKLQERFDKIVMFVDPSSLLDNEHRLIEFNYNLIIEFTKFRNLILILQLPISSIVICRDRKLIKSVFGKNIINENELLKHIIQLLNQFEKLEYKVISEGKFKICMFVAHHLHTL